MLSVMSSIKADVVWLEKDYDFGLMKEEAGPRTGSVRLVNTGPEPVVITGARPSCGCTGVAYPEDPIEPGDTVNFSFTYNPLGRPGKFAKSIRVYIGDFDMATIRIRGNVLGTPESLTTLYPALPIFPLRSVSRQTKCSAGRFLMAARAISSSMAITSRRIPSASYSPLPTNQ